MKRKKFILWGEATPDDMNKKNRYIHDIIFDRLSRKVIICYGDNMERVEFTPEVLEEIGFLNWDKLNEILK